MKIKILLTLVALAYEVNAQCKLTANMIENEPRIYAIEYKGQLLPLRQDTVAVGTTIYLICDERPAVTRVCQRNGRFDRAMPVGRCTEPIESSVEEITDSSCNYKAYHVGYRVGEKFLELYRSCYDKENVRAVYTVHDAWYYSTITSRPESQFTTDRIISGNDAATFKTESVYNRFTELLGAGQTYVKSTKHTIIDRGHLTPSADYLFMPNMRATFKFINAIPQFSRINQGNWKTIENWVRSRVASASDLTMIMTGAFDEVLKLPDINNNLVSMYLGAGTKNPIPKWIYKIYTDDRGRTIFITYNNIFDKNRPTAPCRTVNCPIHLHDSKEYGFTFCCDVSSFQVN